MLASTKTLLDLATTYGTGLDTVSVQQVELGLKAGFKPEEIIFTPSGESIESIEGVAKLGVRINFGSVELLEQFAQNHPGHPVFIRFNPDVIAGGNANVSVGHKESKFGISIDQLPYVLKIIEALDVKVEGVHVHTGSDILDIDDFLKSTGILFDVCVNFKHLKYVDVGSGFKVKYKPDDIETDIEQLGIKLAERHARLSEKLGKEITLIVEPGKFLVSEAGVFLVKVNLLKQTSSTAFAFVNSGFNHFIRPMFYNAYHEIENISNLEGKKKIYNVVGYLGETDTFGWNRRLNEVRIGDILLFRNAGAYSYSMASNYNSRPRPAEILIYENEPYLIQRRETLEDLTRMNKALPFEFDQL